MIHMKTSYGTIVLEMEAEKAPTTVENFMRYVREGFYDGTIFHRVIDGFVIQGGGFNPDMVQKATHGPIPNEAMNGLRNVRGAICMARTSDPQSATSQFFINLVDNDFLNYTASTPEGFGYCVFGRVVDGINVIEQIRGVPTASRFGFKDVPIKDVILEKVDIVSD